MKEIVAIIRPEKWNKTRTKLMEAGILAYTQHRVHGRGKQKGLRYLRVSKDGNTSAVGMHYIPKRLVSLVVPDACVETAIRTLVEVNKTDSIGDGKIFVAPVEEVIRIRTGEVENALEWSRVAGAGRHP